MTPTASIVITLLAGMAVVVGTILIFRLHAFLALLLGALTVALLTPKASLEDYAVRNFHFASVPAEADNGFVIVLTEEQQKQIANHDSVAVVHRDNDFYSQIGTVKVISSTKIADEFELKMQITDGQANPGDLIIAKPDFQQARSFARQTLGARIASAFGSTCGKIGIVIAMAAIIGRCLLESGAADRVVRSALKVCGVEGAPVAFLFSGFLLAIPVFFDTVFYLMIPLGKAMRLRTGKHYLLYIMTIIAGGTMAHSLVPPTPGPLVIAEILGVSIGVMIIAGGIVGLCTAAAGYVYSIVLTRYVDVPLRETGDITNEELQAISDRSDSDLPSLFWSLVPIVLPVLLISIATVIKMMEIKEPATLIQFALTIGDKNITLIISAAIALALLARQNDASFSDLAGSIQIALASGGTIILITAAGGAFGQMLQQTGVASLLGNASLDNPILMVLLAYGITVLIRTAQGSSTVAMITAAGIMAGITVPFHPVYLAIVIGCGSKSIMWMNDSGFWVVSRMSGLTEAEMLKYLMPMTTFMGVIGALVVMLGVTFFPMV